MYSMYMLRLKMQTFRGILYKGPVTRDQSSSPEQYRNTNLFYISGIGTGTAIAIVLHRYTER